MEHKDGPGKSQKAKSAIRESVVAILNEKANWYANTFGTRKTHTILTMKRENKKATTHKRRASKGTLMVSLFSERAFLRTGEKERCSPRATYGQY